MILKKNKKNVCYIGCSRCNHIEYLTPEDINIYIQEKDVRCPSCGGWIEARLGYKGSYIRCNDGHCCKPDEI